MAGEIQLNSTTMATESSGSITAELDTIRPNTTNGSLVLQGDSSDSGVTGLTIDSSGNATFAETISGGTIGSGVVMPSFVGMVAAFAMSSAPSGWLVCNGAEYAIADYGDLHTAITTTWGSLTDGSGGAGSTHFRVPDLSGAFLRGSGTQTYTNTYNGGSVGDKSVDTFKSHAHSVNYYSSGGGSNSPFGGSRFVATFTGNTNATGDTETKPFNVTILYCIKH